MRHSARGPLEFGMRIIRGAARGVFGGLKRELDEARPAQAWRDMGDQMDELARATAQGDEIVPPAGFIE
jgi:hypothetical protein